MSSENFDTLTGYLFDQLNAITNTDLTDDELDRELSIAKSMVTLSDAAIKVESAKLERNKFDYEVLGKVGLRDGTDF